MKNILADTTLHLRCMGLYNPLLLEGEGMEFGYIIFEELPPFLQNLPLR